MIDLIRPQDPRWERILAGLPHDIHHSAGYQRYAAEAEGGEPYLLVVGDADRGLAWPYRVRPVGDVAGLEGSDAKDIGSLHGYTGPVAWGLAPGDPWLLDAWRDVAAAWRDHGAVSAFARFHPLLRNRDLAVGFDDVGGEAIVTAGETVSIDCTLSDEAAVADYARVTRQEIARARRAGLAGDHDEAWRHADDFLRHYAATMERNAAAPTFDLAGPQLDRMRADLGDALHLLVVRRAPDDVLAAGLFSERCGIVQALFVGVDASARRHSPLKVLLDEARRWAARRGDRVLHLGGGRGGRSDSLLEFKARFSPRRHTLHIGRWVLDPKRHAELSDARRAQLRAEGRPPIEGWFPAYRAPAAEPAISG